MNCGFKFEIGDTCVHTAVGTRHAKALLFIVERTLQQCPGGIQRHYGCRTVSVREITYGLTNFNEIELEAATVDDIVIPASWLESVAAMKRAAAKADEPDEPDDAA